VHGAGAKASALGLLFVVSMGAVSAVHFPPATAVQPGQPVAMTFGVMDTRISYGIPSYDTQAVQNADLSMLFSTDASCVDVHVGFAPWLARPVDTATVSTVSNVIGEIRGAGKCLVMADASSESYRANPIPWSQFKTAWVQRVATLAKLYHPDYYIVVKELRWYGPMISDAATNPSVQSAAQWVALTQALAKAVHFVSPNTKVGVSVDASSLASPQYQALYTKYLLGVSHLPGLAFIGFDVYDASDQAATQSYVDSYGTGGKDVWIPETWSSPNPGTSADAASDAQWMAQVYQFATQIHASFLIPFYTDLFSSYTWDTNSTDIVNSFANREPVFYSYQSLAELYGTTQSGP
jgi:hypothetical protein